MKKFYIFISIVVGVMVGGIFNNFWLQVFAESSETFAENLPEIYIKAVNPGYSVDGTANVGEMIEIGRKNSDDVISLAGLKIGYTNSSGNAAILAEFSEYLQMAGETILLRLASSPERELANLLYSKTLAFKAGPLVLMRGDEIIDSVCWTGKDGCAAAFNSSNPTALVRNLETGEFEHLSNYTPSYDPESVFSTTTEADEGGEVIEVTSQCKGMEFSEILSYYETLQSEQFIELYNRSTETIRLDGCSIKYKNKTYALSGMIPAEGYYAYFPSEFKLTKNPTTSNTLELIDANGDVLDKLEYPNGQRKGTAYAFIGYDSEGKEIWKVTYAPTPGEANNYQEFRTCEAGKVINEATGNCVKVTSVAEKICGEGQYLNILTGRCKKIPETTEKTCKEGYYLYEETGRCRKITENTGADYALVPETYKEESSFVALYLVLGVVGVGLVYVVYEFRHDILKIFRRVKWW